MITNQNTSTITPSTTTIIVITNEKGGVGKSTVTALLTDYLIWTRATVQVIDTDPQQTINTWLSNCAELGRPISSKSATYQIIDTAGSSGAALAYLRSADLILVPLQCHYAELNEF